MPIIAFFSQKGGCGKTTTCVNIAGALAALGRRVLICDLDGNACASRTFGVIAGLEASLAAALLGRVPLTQLLQPTPWPTLWLAPGAPDLHVIEAAGEQAAPDRQDAAGRLGAHALRAALSELAPAAFDYVLLDCPGGHPFMERLALLASDGVVVPTGLAVYDLFAATPTLQVVLEARQARGDDRPAFLGFLPNGAGKRGVPPALQARLDRYDLPCLPPIRHSATLKTMAGRPSVPQRLLIFARPHHPAAQSLRAAAEALEAACRAAALAS